MAKGEVKNRFPAVAVGHNINPGNEDEGKAPQVEVEMRGLENEAGKQFWLYLSLHEKAQEITAKILRTLGWKCSDITKLEGLGSVQVDIVEKEREYKGKIYPDYQVWPKRGPRATLREEDQSSFANRFKGLAAAVKPTEVTEFNAAPPVLPEVVVRNAAPTASNGAGSPADLYE